MTNEELQAAEAKITEAETEIAALDQHINACIEKAREFNLERRVASGKRTALVAGIGPVRAAVAEHYAAERAEKKRLAIEKAQAEAEAKAAQAAGPDVAELQKENERLRAELAAKG